MSGPVIFWLCWCAFGLGSLSEQFRQIRYLDLLKAASPFVWLTLAFFAIVIGPLNCTVETDVETGKVRWVWNRPK